MSEPNADLFKSASIVFGALRLWPELGEPYGVDITSHSGILIRGLSAAAVLAWTDHLTEVAFSSHPGTPGYGIDNRFNFRVTGSLRGVHIEVNGWTRSPQACALLAAEPLTVDVLGRIAELESSS